VQRRLAQLKIYGVNAVRTAHDPPSPDFLDLCDRMGILVMNEFFDVWTTHKYTDVGDYATYFNKAATNPTGMPAVPGATNPKWYEVDVTGIVMRDRNHPSVALYSAGNEIRDALATRTTILTRIVDLVHTLDSTRPVTQGLFRPADSGDITGATRTLLDVFGANYRSDEVLSGMQASPARPGVLTEMGTQTATWATVAANAGLTGSFIWTGVDYLGESDGAWPTVGGNFGILDSMGTPKSGAFSWQTTWGLTKTTFLTGAVAGEVVLTADHASITAAVPLSSKFRAHERIARRAQAPHERALVLGRCKGSVKGSVTWRRGERPVRIGTRYVNYFPLTGRQLHPSTFGPPGHSTSGHGLWRSGEHSSHAQGVRSSCLL
jgi:beta-galactosidase